MSTPWPEVISLLETDPPAVELLHPQSQRPILIICDHASRIIPTALYDEVGPLGVPTEVLDRHIAWDIGAAGVTRAVANALEATAVIAGYSRLIVDLNRALGDEDLALSVADGVEIPANVNLSDRALRDRAEKFYWPYHVAIERELARLRRAVGPPMLVSIHSFTPELSSGKGGPRLWHASVMCGRDERLARYILKGLEKVGRPIGFNQPYSGLTHAHCMKAHAAAQGLAHVQLELRQDLVADASGQCEWAGDYLVEILRKAIQEPSLRAIEHN